MTRTSRPLALILALAITTGVAVVVAPVLAGQTPQAEKETFTGFAINMNSGPKTAVVDFTIERWSTDAERTSLLSILVEQKDVERANRQMRELLEDMPKTGFIRGANMLGYDLRYARQNPLPDGGRRIVVATDRPIGFWEATNQPRTMDYPFTIVEIRLDRNDQGEGRILAGTRLSIDKENNLVLENYGQQPVRFNEIRKVK